MRSQVPVVRSITSWIHVSQSRMWTVIIGAPNPSGNADPPPPLRQRTLRTCRWTVLQGARPCEEGGDGPHRVAADRLSPALPRRGWTGLCVGGPDLVSCAHVARLPDAWLVLCLLRRPPRGLPIIPARLCGLPAHHRCRPLPPTHTLPRFPAVSTCVRGPLLAVRVASCRCHSFCARPCSAPCGALRRICRRRPSGNSRRPLRSLYVVMRVFVAWASAQLFFFSLRALAVPSADSCAGGVGCDFPVAVGGVLCAGWPPSASYGVAVLYRPRSY